MDTIRNVLFLMERRFNSCLDKALHKQSEAGLTGGTRFFPNS